MIPHRVIYKQGKRNFTRVFGSLELAEKFQKETPESRIQLASEPVDFLPQSNKIKANSITRVPCSCGKRKRLISRPCCSVCDGMDTSKFYELNL